MLNAKPLFLNKLLVSYWQQLKNTTKMKKLHFMALVLIFPITSFAQNWNYPLFNLSVSKKGGNLVLCNLEMDDSLTLKADTIFLLKSYNFELFLYKKNDMIGIFDPHDFVTRTKPIYSHFTFLDSANQILLLKHKKQYQIVEGTNLTPVFKETFDTIYPIQAQNPHNYYVVSKKSRKGIISLQLFDYILPIEFNKIDILEVDYNRILTILQKGKKYGAGDYLGIEVQTMYDEVKYIGGSRKHNLFRVKKKNKYGLVYETELRYPTIFDTIEFVGKPWPYGYIILKSEGKYDVAEDNMLPFKPKYDKVWTEKKENKVIIYMKKDGKTETIEQKLTDK